MWLLIAAINGALAVAAGAFGAHALKARLAPDLLAIWNTAAHYHLIHAVVLVALALVALAVPTRGVTLQATLFLAGTAVFSGTLYVLALTGLRWLGAITPLGGLALIAGWLSLALLARPR